jgi:hypothetical protein
LSKGVVAEYVKSVEQANLGWHEARVLNEAALSGRLVPKPIGPADYL